ncbi:LPS translocon maturation chaperone LptM [Providencia stuartii]|uniref:LPS translocon maturation chaperone LptM n=1 Tax=Providencia stuartii TaxID=588 RepID=UPI0013D8165E|nr:lipoprotein [Providencia stuartii]
MKKSLVGLSALIILFTLSGCGLKGPLYFPPEDKATLSQSSDETQNSTAADSRVSTSNQQ